MKNELTTVEKIALVNEWQHTHIKLDTAIEDVRKVIRISLDSPLLEAIWEMQALATIHASKLIDDRAGWLEWYAHETNFGLKTGLKVTVNKKKMAAKDAKGIVKIIEAHNAIA